MMALVEERHDAWDEEVVQLQDPGAEQTHHADGINLERFPLFLSWLLICGSLCYVKVLSTL